MNNPREKSFVREEIQQKAWPGMPVLIINTLLIIASIFLIIFGATLMAVSYTHLDVYKRQTI